MSSPWGLNTVPIDNIHYVYVGRSQAQVAIRWLLHQSAVSSVVIGAKTLSQLEDNCAAGFNNWTLNEDQVFPAFIYYLIFYLF